MEHIKTSEQKGRKSLQTYFRAAVLSAVVFVLFLAGWHYVPVMGSQEAKYCASCHSMAPEYMTWQESNHAQFQCKECHRQSGVANFFKYQAMIYKDLLFYKAGGDPIKKATKSIPDSVCLKCHSPNRLYSPSSDTLVPHTRHTAEGISCVTCHAGLAHGRIVERGITAKIPAEEWNPSIAAEQMEFKNTTPRMEICLNCHGERKVTEKCSVCHSQQIVPASHKSGEFEKEHGLMARQDFKRCNLCHSYSLKKPVDLLEMNVSDYLRTNSFCFNCHLNKPTSHKAADFGAAHGSLAKSRGNANCFGCHDIQKKAAVENRGPVNEVYCNKCHWFK